MHITPLGIHFRHLFENVVLGSLKSFFQLNQEVDTVFYHTETTTLHHSKRNTSFENIFMYFQSP